MAENIGLPEGFVIEPQQEAEQGLSMPAGFQIEPSPDELVDDELTWKETFSSAVQNLPSSAAQFGSDFISTFLHPVETAKATGQTLIGGVQKLIPGEQEYEQNFDTLIDFYKDRYGSVEGFKESVANDPVGVLSDGASFIAPGGAIIKGAGTTAKIKTLARVGEIAKRTGKILDPTNVVIAPIKAAANRIPKSVYGQVAKLSPSMPKAKRDMLIKTAMDHGIMPTAKGLDKLKSRMNVVGKQIGEIIDHHTNRGVEVPANSIFRELKGVRQEFKHFSSAQEAIDKVVKDLKSVKTGKQNLTPKELQDLKTSIYKQLNTSYEKQMSLPVKTETKKAIAKGAKLVLEEMHPELKALNWDYGKMKQLSRQLEKSANRISNRDLISWRTAPTAGGGFALGGLDGLMLGMGVDLISRPTVQASLALAIDAANKVHDKISPVTGTARRTAVTAQRAGLVNEDEGEE